MKIKLKMSMGSNVTVLGCLFRSSVKFDFFQLTDSITFFLFDLCLLFLIIESPPEFLWTSGVPATSLESSLFAEFDT